MSPELNRRFMGQWPAIKGEWLKLLRGEPLLSPLGRPDTLGFLMDATLMQLQVGLEAPPGESWLDHCRSVAGAVHRHCACGVIPVVRYFQTGEQALRTATSADFAASLDEILARFRLLAQHEAGTLCAACAHPGWEGCELRKSTFPA